MYFIVICTILDEQLHAQFQVISFTNSFDEKTFEMDLNADVVTKIGLEPSDENFIQGNDDDSVEEEALTDSIFEADFDDITDFDGDEQMDKLSQKDKVSYTTG